MADDHSKLDRAEQSLSNLVLRQRYDETNRLTLLIMHGVGALIVGMLLAISEPPAAWRTLVPNDSFDWILWIPALTGGLFLLSGLWNHRNLYLELLGMSLIFIWDVMMVVIFAKNAAQIGTNAALYPISVYFTFASLMGVHIKTVITYMRRKK